MLIREAAEPVGPLMAMATQIQIDGLRLVVGGLGFEDRCAVAFTPQFLVIPAELARIMSSLAYLLWTDIVRTPELGGNTFAFLVPAYDLAMTLRLRRNTQLVLLGNRRCPRGHRPDHFPIHGYCIECGHREKSTLPMRLLPEQRIRTSSVLPKGAGANASIGDAIGAHTMAVRTEMRRIALIPIQALGWSFGMFFAITYTTGMLVEFVFQGLMITSSWALLLPQIKGISLACYAQCVIETLIYG
ncbi:hypothetical protein H2509_00050 [Stappia sp. F7233]|uniref:Uncharacterized protein n=1 Tax=Stappia albiluteola TaxID=2758565 RepID=A0A839A863_9HYPH|nr:hypothetical protein [Stappia albiluteola]MBA5775511.1 hypothetical protein [Stappia albiluteola]